MIATCPHCQKKLKLSPNVESGLRMLSPGKSLRINCPQCGEAILLDASMMTTPQPSTKKADSSKPHPPSQQITPPPPPDLSGLSENAYEGKGIIEDIPKVLILMPDSPNSSLITAAMEGLGYQTAFAQSAEDAMEKMQFVNYASVILHSHYEDSPFENGVFHQFMCNMNMHKRRYIFYILIGPEFHTLYDLEALACSANLVVNDQDLSQLAIILRTAIPKYEGMFGAIMQEMSVLGR
jgi:hypothetical protein